MFTKFVLASAVAIALGLPGLSSAAMAESDWNPNSSYNPPYDIPIYKQTLRHSHAVIHHAAMSCAAARRRVIADGYRHVTARDCDGRSFTFKPPVTAALWSCMSIRAMARCGTAESSRSS